MINAFEVYEALFHHFNNKPVMVVTMTNLLFVILGVVSYRLIRLMRVRQDIPPDFRDDNECMDGDDKCVTMIVNLCY